MHPGEVIVAVIVLFVVLGAIGYVLSVYNGLVALKNNIPRSWANIDVLLKQRHDVIVRFMQAYRETLDWMYSDPEAIKTYAAHMRMSESLVQLQRDEFNPKEALNPDRLSDLDLVMQDAIAGKFLEKPLTPEQLAEFIQIPHR